MRTYEAAYKHEAAKLAEEIDATKAAKELLMPAMVKNRRARALVFAAV